MPTVQPILPAPVAATLRTVDRQMRAGSLTDAERGLTAVATHAAAHPPIALMLGRLKRQRGDRAGAAACLQRYLALCPQDSAALLELADALAGSGRLTEAEGCLNRALALDPGSEALRTAGATLRLAVAAHAEARGDRDAAKASARAALALRPDHPAAHDTLCRLLVKEDMPAAARHALAAWRADRGNATFAGNVWQLFTHMGEAGEVERFERQLAVQEDCAALVGLGNALRRAGQAQRAEACYRRALERFPEVSFTLSRLACLCAEQQRLDEADALFREAAARHGGRDVVTRTAPAFLAELKAAPAPAGITAEITEGAAVAAAPLIVYASCDAGYFRLFVPAMVRSLVDNAGLEGAAIALHLVNPDAAAEAELDALLRAHGPERFIVIRERVDLAPLGAQAKTYYACSRFLLLPDLLARYGRPLLMLDVDLMAIRPLAPLLAASAGADFGMMSNALKRLDIWSLLYADVVHIRPTPRAHRFLDLVRRYVRHFLKPGTAHWFLDQAALAGTYLAGFADEPAPRFVWYPTDMHSSTIMLDAEGNYWTEEHASFYSVRATGGGQTAMARAKRRAGTIAELNAAQGSVR